jgi:hypothetical protein
MVDRTTTNLFSMSNQNGAPSETAQATTHCHTVRYSDCLFLEGRIGRFEAVRISTCQTRATGGNSISLQRHRLLRTDYRL